MEERILWYDAMQIKNEEEFHKIVSLAINNGYAGIVINEIQYKWCKRYTNGIKKIVYIQEIKHKEYTEIYNTSDSIILSDKVELLENEVFLKFEKVPYIKIADQITLLLAVQLSKEYHFLVVDFESKTNIPLELLLTHAQKNKTIICKKVRTLNDGWVATMVMESGSQGIVFDSKNLKDIVALSQKTELMMKKKVLLEELEIISIEHIGMGDRICVDTISALEQDEGMLLGCTSDGGILVSSETHYLPYMELRPFRVNAGALHMYAWNDDEKTDYLSELKAGTPVMIVNSKGEGRIVAVGRIKMEKRPILLITAKSKKGIQIKVALQDDWHVRIIGKNGKPFNCTELKPGDLVLGCVGQPGRHVGYKIKENISEK